MCGVPWDWRAGADLDGHVWLPRYVSGLHHTFVEKPAARGGFSVAGLAAAVIALTAPQSSSGSRSQGSGRPQSPSDSERLRLRLTVSPSLLAAALALVTLALLLQREDDPLLPLNGEVAGEAARTSECEAGGERRQAMLPFAAA